MSVGNRIGGGVGDLNLNPTIQVSAVNVQNANNTFERRTNASSSTINAVVGRKYLFNDTGTRTITINNPPTDTATAQEYYLIEFDNANSCSVDITLVGRTITFTSGVHYIFFDGTEWTARQELVNADEIRSVVGNVITQRADGSLENTSGTTVPNGALVESLFSVNAGVGVDTTINLSRQMGDFDYLVFDIRGTSSGNTVQTFSQIFCWRQNLPVTNTMYYSMPVYDDGRFQVGVHNNNGLQLRTNSTVEYNSRIYRIWGVRITV